VLARLQAGIPIPIGAIVGAAVGVWFFGVGAAVGANIGDATGFLISGFEGGINFGDNRIEIDGPLELLEAPILFSPLSVDRDAIIAKVEKAAQNTHQLLNDGDDTNNSRIYTWNDGFTITGAGTLTNKYVAGMIGGTLTFGINVGFPELAGVDDEGKNFGVELFASGSIDILGMSLANTGIVFDFNDPLSPGVHMAFGLPGINGNLLGMLLPATGQFGASFTTDGVLYGGVLATGKLLTDIVQGGLASGQAFFDETLNVIAARLEGERLARLAQEGGWDPLSDKLWLRPSRLLQIVLDVDGTGTFSTRETQDITREFMVNRLLGLLSVQTNVDPNSLLIPANAADAIVNQIMEVGSQLAPQFDLHPLDVAPLILSHAKQTLQDSLEEFLSVADPSFTVEGFVQPVLMGIPFGPPTNRVELRLDKDGVLFGFDTTLLSLMNAATAVLATMGVPDVPLGMTVSLPIGAAILNALLAEGPLDPLDSNDPGWGIEIHSSLRVAGFDVGTIKGLAIPPNANPDTFLADHIQLAWELEPDEVPDSTRILIHTQEHYDALVSHGGILLNGMMQAPKLLTDPLAVFDSLNDLESPEGALDYPGWLGEIAQTLTQIVTPAQIQLFIPSLHKALVTSFDNACPAFDPNVTYTDAELAALCPEEGRVTITAAAADILQDAYLAGTWEGSLLSVPLGKGRIEGTSEGLLVVMEEPLIGLELEFLVDFQARTINEVEVQFPRAQASVLLDTAKTAQILQSLGLPENVLKPPGGLDASFRAYSPGFSDDPLEPDLIRRVGGFEIDAALSLPNLVENAEFHVRVPLFAAIGAGIPPDFTASASIPELTIPGLSTTGDLLKVRDLFVDIRSEQGDLSMTLRGGLEALGFTFTTHGDLEIVDTGVYGNLLLTLGDGETFGSGLGFEADGTFHLQVNTTGVDQTLDGTPIPAGGRILVDGELIFDNGFSLEGAFGLTITGGAQPTLLVTATDAVLDLRGWASLTANGFLQIDSTGIAAQLTLTTATGTGDVSFGDDVSLSASLFLQVNTTGDTVEINPPAGGALTVPGGSSYARVRADGNLVFFDVFDLDGTFDLTVSGSGLHVAADAEFDVLDVQVHDQQRTDDRRRRRLRQPAADAR
jgi:hypothetical protein